MSSWRDVTAESFAEESTEKMEVQEHKSNGLITQSMSEEEEVSFSLTVSVDNKSCSCTMHTFMDARFVFSRYASKNVKKLILFTCVILSILIVLIVGVKACYAVQTMMYFTPPPPPTLENLMQLSVMFCLLLVCYLPCFIFPLLCL